MFVFLYFLFDPLRLRRSVCAGSEVAVNQVNMNDLGELIVRVAPNDNLRRATGVFLCDGVVSIMN